MWMEVLCPDTNCHKASELRHQPEAIPEQGRHNEGSDPTGVKTAFLLPINTEEVILKRK